MAAEDTGQPRMPRALSYPLSLIAFAALLAAAAALVYSLAGVLFTNVEDSMLWAVFAFLGTAFLGVYAFVFRPAPLGMMWRGFFGIGQLFGSLNRALFVMAFLSLLVTFAGCAHGNVPPYDELPIFARRSHYVLRGGPEGYFEVSRVRYLMSGAGFHVGWHCGALAAVFWVLQSICCGTPKRADERESSAA